MAITLGVDQKVLLTIGEKDAHGNDVVPAGITVTSSDETVAVIETVDEANYFVVGTGKAGSSQVTVSDADDNLTGTETLVFAAIKPTSLSLGFGEPVDIAPPAPPAPAEPTV